LRIAARENRPAILYQLWQHIKPIEVTEDYISRRRCLLESAAWGQVFSVILLLDWSMRTGESTLALQTLGFIDPDEL
jgi:hypothetical protein